MTPRGARRGEGVATVARLGERVGSEAQADACIDELVHHGLVGPGVEVVHQLGALVADEAGVFEAGRPFHAPHASRRVPAAADPPPTGGTTGGLCEHLLVTAPTTVPQVEFWYDPMCPYAYQTSVWIRRVREVVPMDIVWKFFSLEEVNREEGKKHPWERPLSYGWTPMRVGAWLRRLDPALGDRWYEVCGHALHRDARRFYDREIALELLASIGAPTSAWDDALADETTHDDVRADHEYAVRELAGFGVPIIRVDGSRALFGPVVAPAPEGADALKLWEAVVAYVAVPGLFEIKTPKTPADLTAIGALFEPYLTARQWKSVQNPAP